MVRVLKKTVILSLLALLLLSGCGNNKGELNTDVGGEKYRYISSSEKLSNRVSYSTVGTVKVADDRVYRFCEKEDGEKKVRILTNCRLDGLENTLVTVNDDANSHNNAEQWFLLENGGFSVVYVSDNGQNTRSYRYVTYNAEGEKISEMSPDRALRDAGEYLVKDYFLAEDGSLIVIGATTVYQFDKDGNAVETVSVGTSVNNAFMDSKKNLYVQFLFVNKYTAAEVDFANHTLGKPLENVPINNNPWFECDGKFLILTDRSLNTYDMDKCEAEKVFDWLDIDRYAPYPDAVWMQGDSLCYLCRYADDEGEGVEITTVMKVVDDGNRKDIVIGCTDYNPLLGQIVSEYNNAQNNYRVKIKDYASCEDPEEALKRDLLLGGIIDIIDNTTFFVEIDEKECYYDLNTFIDKDPSFHREDYFENALKCQEVEGGLYALSPSFEFMTLIANSKYVGTNPSWTLDEFLAFHAKCSVLPFGDKMDSRALLYYLAATNRSIVDRDHGTCDFTGGDFVRIMELCKAYPVITGWETYSSFKDLREETLLMEPVNISMFDHLQVYDASMNGNANFIGFPVNEGYGQYYLYSTGYSILKNSQCPNGAWSFIKYTMDSPYIGTTSFSGFPVNKSQFEKVVERAKNQDVHTWVIDGVNIEVGPPSEKDLELLRTMIDKSTARIDLRGYVDDIIREEASYYFIGDKSAEDVADLLQTRIGLYFEEHK